MIWVWVSSVIAVVLCTYFLHRFYKAADEAALKDSESKYHINHLRRKNK